MIQEGLFIYNLSDNYTAKIFKEKTLETVNSGAVQNSELSNKLSLVQQQIDVIKLQGLQQFNLDSFDMFMEIIYLTKPEGNSTRNNNFKLFQGSNFNRKKDSNKT